MLCDRLTTNIIYPDLPYSAPIEFTDLAFSMDGLNVKHFPFIGSKNDSKSLKNIIMYYGDFVID